MIKKYIQKIVDDRIKKLEIRIDAWTTRQESIQEVHRDGVLSRQDQHAKQVEQYLKGFNSILKRKFPEGKK